MIITNNVLKDSHNILNPTNQIMINEFPCFNRYASSISPNTYNSLSKTYRIKNNIYNFIHSTNGLITMKMLRVYEDGKEHSYFDICNRFNFTYGHDIDCWKSLRTNQLIEFSSKHGHGREYYVITEIGKELIKILDINQAYYKIARWLKIKDEDERIRISMQCDLQGEESWKDLMPESINALLENLFNPNSDMHNIGSCYRWMNNIINFLKTDKSFYENMNNPEVIAWFNAHKQYDGVETFLKKFNKIAKKHNKS